MTSKRSRQAAENAATFLQPANQHEWIRFDNVDVATRNEYNEVLLELRNKPIEVARILNWDDLSDNLAQNLRIKLAQVYENNGYRIESMAWERLFGMRAPIFEELCREFFSTYRFNHRCRDFADPHMLSFRLGGVPRHISLIEFAIRMGLYTEEQASSPIFGEYLGGCVNLPTRDFDVNGSWEAIGEGEFRSSSTHAARIRSPLLKLIQKLLAYSVMHRSNGRDKLKTNELWLLTQIMEEETRVNVPYLLAYFLSKAKGIRSESAMCGGHYITILAESFNILSQNVRQHLRRVPQEIRYIDIYELHGAGILGQPHGQQGDEVEHDEEEEHRGVPPGGPSFIQQGHSAPTLESMDYRLRKVEYTIDWMQHNMTRWFEMTPAFQPTPYQPPPPYGTPGAHYPPPRYDMPGYTHFDMGGGSSSQHHDSEFHRDDLED